MCTLLYEWLHELNKNTNIRHISFTLSTLQCVRYIQKHCIVIWIFCVTRYRRFNPCYRVQGRIWMSSHNCLQKFVSIMHTIGVKFREVRLAARHAIGYRFAWGSIPSGNESAT